MPNLEAKPLREFVFTVPLDADLLPAIVDLISRLRVNAGTVSFIGALRSATLLYYVQDEKRFHKNFFEGPLEIVSGSGNIATLDGKPMVHCHVVLADRNGLCIGGHLAEGSRVFAAEVHIRELSPALKRSYDEATGLNPLEI